MSGREKNRRREGVGVKKKGQYSVSFLVAGK